MILDSFRLDGRVAVVTGTSRGLGQGAALALAEAGADLALIDRGDASETAARIEATGRRVHRIHRDFATATANRSTSSAIPLACSPAPHAPTCSKCWTSGPAKRSKATSAATPPGCTTTRSCASRSRAWSARCRAKWWR